MCARHEESLAWAVDNGTSLMNTGSTPCDVVGAVWGSLTNIDAECALSRDELLRMAAHVAPVDDDTQ